MPAVIMYAYLSNGGVGSSDTETVNNGQAKGEVKRRKKPAVPFPKPPPPGKRKRTRSTSSALDAPGQARRKSLPQKMKKSKSTGKLSRASSVPSMSFWGSYVGQLFWKMMPSCRCTSRQGMNALQRTKMRMTGHCPTLEWMKCSSAALRLFAHQENCSCVWQRPRWKDFLPWYWPAHIWFGCWAFKPKLFPQPEAYVLHNAISKVCPANIFQDLYWRCDYSLGNLVFSMNWTLYKLDDIFALMLFHKDLLCSCSTFWKGTNECVAANDGNFHTDQMNFWSHRAW